MNLRKASRKLGTVCMALLLSLVLVCSSVWTVSAQEDTQMIEEEQTSLSQQELPAEAAIPEPIQTTLPSVEGMPSVEETPVVEAPLPVEEIPMEEEATASPIPEGEGGKQEGGVAPTPGIVASPTPVPEEMWTVTFMGRKGSAETSVVIGTAQVKEGAAATAPEPPAVYGQHFTGWDQEFANVQGDLTVTAQYATNLFSATYSVDPKLSGRYTLSHGGGEQDTRTYERGIGAFGVWLVEIATGKEIHAVTQIMNSSASGVEKNSGAPRDFAPGEVVSIPNNGNAYVGEKLMHTRFEDGATFSIMITLAVNDPVVTFVDSKGISLKTETVSYDGSATPPEASEIPTIPGKTFDHWEGSYTNVTQDTTVTATYRNNKVTVIYTLDQPLQDGYTLNNGSGQLTKYYEADPSMNCQITAFGAFLKVKNASPPVYVFAVSQFLENDVTGMDVNGNAVSFQTGELVSSLGGDGNAKPTAALRTTYFPDGQTIYITVKAVHYNVTFVGEDKQIIETKAVLHGGKATAPQVPNVVGKTFTGWDVSFENVTQDLTVTAQYETTVYEVTFLDENGQKIDIVEAAYGTVPNAPNPPEIEGMKFMGWKPALAEVTENVEIYAQYEKIVPVPTTAPTTAPTGNPTTAPTVRPTALPTTVPTAVPTTAPTAAPTVSPTALPTTVPTAVPTATPTTVPTTAPTATPAPAETTTPTAAPTATPSPTETPVAPLTPDEEDPTQPEVNTVPDTDTTPDTDTPPDTDPVPDAPAAVVPVNPAPANATPNGVVQISDNQVPLANGLGGDKKYSLNVMGDNPVPLAAGIMTEEIQFDFVYLLIALAALALVVVLVVIRNRRKRMLDAVDDRISLE